MMGADNQARARLCWDQRNSKGELLESFSQVNIEKYGSLVSYVSKLSALFSDSANAAVDSRFVEKLFCRLTQSKDVARKDVSFDAVFGIDAGVGIKTFVAGINTLTKTEKVAEFAKDATAGVFQGLSNEERAHKVTQLRNKRILSDTAEMGLSLTESFYHCLVRRPEVAFVHEESYSLIDPASIIPTNRLGNPVKAFTSSGVGHVYFTDGLNQYTYNVSKNVLMKKFDLNSGYNSASMPTPIDFDIWATLLGPEVSQEPFMDRSEPEVTDEDFVILPLYSTKSLENKQVAERSGINQWNAGGRTRKFGEAYIPVPSIVHKLSPGFFPERDVTFTLVLPNGQQVVAKLCQDGSKALMSSPNDVLCEWLFASIDGSLAIAEKRLTDHSPYSYEDLRLIGKDSVRVTRTPEGPTEYQLELAPIGSFEEFLDANSL